MADPQAFSSPEIERKAQELTEGKTELIEKLRSLCRFAQKDVRYVAIELGQGAYRPRSAGEVLTNRYGDCKDKVTILRAMLRKVGLEAYPVLIRSGSRQSVVGEFPSPKQFNHLIAAIPLASPPVNWTTVELPGIGSAILFDPTDDIVPLGDFPWYLQGTKALLARVVKGRRATSFKSLKDDKRQKASQPLPAREVLRLRNPPATRLRSLPCEEI